MTIVMFLYILKNRVMKGKYSMFIKREYILLIASLSCYH
jgi:hypothetical protein